MPNKNKMVKAPMPTSQQQQRNGRNAARKRRRRNRRSRAENEISEMLARSLRIAGPNQTRKGVAPNPADPRTSSPLLQLGQTVTGRMAALKILHPNGEGDEYVIKFPDGCANTTIAMERRDEFKIEPPSIVSGTKWNVIIVDAPFFLMTQICIRYESTETPSPRQMNTAIAQVMNLPGFPGAQYPAWYTNNILKEGSEPTDFHTQYTILAASALTPSYTNTAVGPAVDIKQIRRTYMGVTIDLDASDLHNEGRVVYGQWKPDVTLAISYQADVQPPLAVNIYAMQAPAVLIQNIVQSDDLCYQAEAKCGLYAPIRVGELDLPMTAAQEWRTIAPVIPTQPTYTPTYDSTSTKDLWLRGWLIGVSHWTDLSIEATLRIKRKEGLEFISSPSGPYAPFATEALASDLRALQMIQEFSRRQPHGYPADYNELGKLLQTILGGVSKAVAGLGLPVISDIAGTVNKVATGQIGNTLAGLLDQIA